MINSGARGKTKSETVVPHYAGRTGGLNSPQGKGHLWEVVLRREEDVSQRRKSIFVSEVIK